MRVHIQFYSYFKDLTGCAETHVDLPDGSTVGDLILVLNQSHPKLAAMAKSTLIAVGVDYQTKDYVLREGDNVSLFPPVQGG